MLRRRLLALPAAVATALAVPAVNPWLPLRPEDLQDVVKVGAPMRHGLALVVTPAKYADMIASDTFYHRAYGPEDGRSEYPSVNRAYVGSVPLTINADSDRLPVYLSNLVPEDWHQGGYYVDEAKFVDTLSLLDRHWHDAMIAMGWANETLQSCVRHFLGDGAWEDVHTKLATPEVMGPLTQKLRYQAVKENIVSGFWSGYFSPWAAPFGK